MWMFLCFYMAECVSYFVYALCCQSPHRFVYVSMCECVAMLTLLPCLYLNAAHCLRLGLEKLPV